MLKDLLTRLGRKAISGLLALRGRLSGGMGETRRRRVVLPVVFEHEGQKALRVYVLLAPDAHDEPLHEMKDRVLKEFRESKAA